MAKGDLNIDRLLEIHGYETPALIKEVQRVLTELNYTLITDDDNYIVGIPETVDHVDNPKIAFVAHMDTVTRTGPFKPVLHNGILRNENGVLGADDRAGVFAILETIKDAPMRPIVIFTNYEETGGRGVKRLVDKDILRDYIDKIWLFVEPDRKGWCDYVYYSHTIPKKTAQFVEKFGYIKDHGSYSDVCDLTKKYLVPHVNLSIGYLWQHTRQEHLDLIDCRNTMRQMSRMLAASGKVPHCPMTEEEVNGPKYSSPWARGTSGNTAGFDDYGRSTHRSFDRKKKGFKGTFDTYEQYIEARGKHIAGEKKQETNEKAVSPPEVGEHNSKSPDEWTKQDWDSWHREWETDLRKLDAPGDDEAVDVDETRMPEEKPTTAPTTGGNYMTERVLNVDGVMMSRQEFIDAVHRDLERIDQEKATANTQAPAPEAVTK